jgi:hypothetical protein
MLVLNYVDQNLTIQSVIKPEDFGVSYLYFESLVLLNNRYYLLDTFNSLVWSFQLTDGKPTSVFSASFRFKCQFMGGAFENG